MSEQTIGAFTVGVARLAKHGDLVFEGSEPSAASDVYFVVMASPNMRPTLANVSGLPAVGTAHPTASLLAVKRLEFVQKAPSSRVWEVTVRYELSGVQRGTPGEDDPPPERSSFQISWGHAETPVDAVNDLAGADPLVNSAGDPFDSVPQFQSFAPELVIRYDSANFPTVAYSHTGFINSSEVTVQGVTFERHCAMLRVSVERRADATYPYAVTVTITGRRNMISRQTGSSTAGAASAENWGWDLGLAQCGFQYLDSDGNKVKFVTFDADGTPRDVSAPMPLDEGGSPADAPAIRRVQVYEEWNFDLLGLSDSIGEEES